MKLSGKYIAYIIFAFIGVLFLVFSITFNPFKKESPTQTNNTNPANNSKPLAPGQINGFRYKILSSEDTYTSFKIAFEEVLQVYITSDDPSDRQRLENIKQLASKSHPKDFKDTDFLIPCLDRGCKEKEITGPIKDITTKINLLGGASLESTLKNSIIDSLTTSAYYPKGSKTAFSSYLSAYDGIKNIYSKLTSQKDKDEAKSAANIVETLISNEFPTEYKSLNSVHYFDFTNTK